MKLRRPHKERIFQLLNLENKLPNSSVGKLKITNQHLKDEKNDYLTKTKISILAAL